MVGVRTRHSWLGLGPGTHGWGKDQALMVRVRIRHSRLGLEIERTYTIRKQQTRFY